MTEFADIFASGLTTAVYVYGSVNKFAGYGLFILSLRRPKQPAPAPREAFGLS